MPRMIAIIASILMAPVAACQTDPDLAVFAAVVADARMPNRDIAPMEQSLGANGRFGVASASVKGGRARWLQSQHIEIVPDTTGIRCLGFTVIAEAAGVTSACPQSVSTIARIGPLVSGTGEAFRHLPPDVLAKPSLHSMSLTITLLMPDGSSTGEYIYVVEFVGGVVNILKRIQVVSS